MVSRPYYIALLIFIGIISCVENPINPSVSSEYVLRTPKGFEEPSLREDNPITNAKIALGKKLFFDPILSLDSSISCGNCHRPQFAYSDPNPISPGVNGKLALRNAPSLSNLAWYPYFFAEGGSPNLEAQILGPVEDPNEMAFSIVKAVTRLKRNEDYVRLFQEAFDTLPSVYTTTRAIAAFERSLVSSKSPFDYYVFHGDSSVFTKKEKLGYELFMSQELNCSSCHAGYLLTDFSFQNNGLFEDYVDPGRSRVTLKKEDEGKFKVPSLRNIEVTGPYMHNGSFNSLEEIIDHYASGGKNHPNKSSKIQGFEISPDEKSALVAFLKTLTDSSYISSDHY